MANMIKTDSTPVPVEPPEPASAAVKELLTAMRDSNLNLDHIVELIAGEPRLSAEILRRGNSVMFGSRAPVTDIFAAVARIGMHEAYSALEALNDSPRPGNSHYGDLARNPPQMRSPALQ
jgi:HD-like signal output (HDOD) protein